VEERVLQRHPAISEAAVYGVPDPVAGDQIMACIVLRSGASLTPAELGAFLAGQGDIGRKQHPRFVRVVSQLGDVHPWKDQPPRRAPHCCPHPTTGDG